MLNEINWLKFSSSLALDKIKHFSKVSPLFKRPKKDLKYLRGRGVFPNHRYMDDLFLNRMNSQQGIVMKKQETIFEILLKSQCRYAPVFSIDP